MAFAGAGVAVLAAGSLSFATANAAETPTLKTLSGTSAQELASKLTSQIKGDAGSYYDAQAKKLVVNVTDTAAKQRVEKAGAEARVVPHTLSQLNSVKDALTKQSVPGTARAVDVKTNKVVVTADRTVTGDKLAKLKKQVAAKGSTVQLKHTAGKFTPKIAGGDAIWGSDARCSLGFNVTTKDGKPGFLTAGHCTTAVDTWSDKQGGDEIAKSTDGKFPGNDYGIATYSGDTEHPSEVDLYGSTQKISGAADAEVGQKVKRSGSTSKVHDGTVKALDASVSYQEGKVDGLIQTDVCAEPGDSGGAMFADDKALGLTSGGSGDCSAGGETYFQPVPAALKATGAKLP